jgi:putative membrane protein insertion efficiency factor
MRTAFRITTEDAEGESRGEHDFSPWSIRVVRVLAAAAMAVVVLNAQSVALAGIHAYQHTLSPLAVRAGIQCRFTPTCSRYAAVVIQRDGVMRGGWKALKRAARCNPLTPAGTRNEP